MSILLTHQIRYSQSIQCKMYNKRLSIDVNNLNKNEMRAFPQKKRILTEEQKERKRKYEKLRYEKKKRNKVMFKIKEEIRIMIIYFNLLITTII